MNQALRFQAQSLLQANDLSGACKIYQQICAEDPQDVESWYLLGALSARSGEFDSAEKAFQHAIKLAPDTVELQDGLGGVLQEMDLPEKAIKYHLHAIKLKPDYPYAHYNLGNAYRKLNQIDKAISSYRKTIKLEPKFTDAHNNLGNALRQQGKFKDAETCYKTALQQDPQAISTLLNLGQVLQSRGKNEEAADFLTSVLSREPENIEANFTMAAIQRERGNHDGAIQHLSTIITIQPELAKAHGSLGNVLVNLGRFEEAILSFENMIKLEPESIDAEACICSVLEKQGKYDKAYSRLEPLLAESINNINVVLTYGFLGNRFGKTDDAIKALRRVLSVPDLTSGEQERLHFGLGRLLDKEGKYKDAFKHYKRGNEARTVNYSPDKTQQQFDALKQVYTREFVSRMPQSHAVDTDKLIFIIGMPRSGTSLVEQIIASHPDVFGAGEQDLLTRITESMPIRLSSPLPFPACVESADQNFIDTLSREYSDAIRQLSSGERFVTDKMPHNFLFLGLIAQLFPNAKIIHCKRKPADTCLSCYFNDFGDRHPYSTKLAYLGEYYNFYSDLMQHWHNVLGLPIFDIQYEDLVSDQETKSKELLAFCEIEWNEQCLNFHDNKRIVATASYDQVRQPMYTSSMKRWVNYEKQLAPLLLALNKGNAN